MQDLNLAIHASKGHLPEAGGMLDQSMKFVNVWQAFQADKDLIIEERRSKKNGR
jgi:hypothetical protein